MQFRFSYQEWVVSLPPHINWWQFTFLLFILFFCIVFLPIIIAFLVCYFSVCFAIKTLIFYDKWFDSIFISCLPPVWKINDRSWLKSIKGKYKKWHVWYFMDCEIIWDTLVLTVNFNTYQHQKWERKSINLTIPVRKENMCKYVLHTKDEPSGSYHLKIFRFFI